MKKLCVFLACLVLVGINLVQAQTVRITGTVTSSEDGMPIPGVSVIAKGTTAGGSTNVDGKYDINVPSNAETLVFTFVGMKTQEVAIGGRAIIDVVLQSESLQVEELVVTALGIKRAEKATGYAIQGVKGDEIMKAREANMVNSLQGKIAGAVITNTSGAVGASSRIVLRGASSLSGSNQPLFVVDGIPISNGNFGSTGTDGVNRGSGVSDINPNDIESVSVLKGPNAAALYGSRAAFGVIIITTKSGKKGKGFGVTYNNTSSWETPLRLPNYQNQYGQGSGGEFEFVDGKGGGVNDGVDESWGPRLDIGLMIPQWFSPVDPVTGVREASPWVSHPDNIKNFFEVGHSITHNVAVEGSSESSTFRFSYTNFDQKGMVPNTDQKRHTISINASANPHKDVTVNVAANYVKTSSDNMPGYGYDAQNVMQQFLWSGRQNNIPDLKQYKYADGTKRNWNYNFHNNPYFTLHENLNGLARDRFYGNAHVTYKITDWLTAKIGSGVDFYTNLNTNRCAWGDNDNAFGYYNEQTITNREINSDFLLMFNKNITEDISFNLNLGGNRMDQVYEWDYVAANELAVEGVYNVLNSKVTPVAQNWLEKKRVNSLLYSGQFAWKNQIFFDFTGRNDWSSTLPDGKNSYFYPSFSLSGIVSDIFNIKSNVLNYAKVRVSWAQVGADTNPYQLAETMSFGEGWNASTKLLNMTTPNTLPNDKLKPEQTTSTEAGLELKLFQSRVSFDATYYNAKSTDQIITAPVSPASGYLAKVINAGEITNKGIELALGVTPIKTKSGFEWNVNFNFAKNKNEVVKLAPGVDQFELGTYWSLKVMAIPGQPYGSLYGYDLKRDPNGNVLNANGLPQQGDLKILGNYSPDWIGGITNEFSYKNLNFSFLIDIRKGGDVYSMTNSWGRYAGVLQETLYGREDGIVGKGTKLADDGVTYVPNDIVVTAEAYNHAAYTDGIAYTSVFDGSFVKLREVKIGYTFDKIGKLPIRDLSINLIGRNLAILYAKIPHVDPESAFSNNNAQGLEFGQLPSARSLGFSVSVKL